MTTRIPAGRGEWLVTAGVVATVLAVYVATLAPGLIAITDTPKFQFIGRILGTAHPPGYPLYVVVSHFFGYLPIGSLAYRINLMSAVLMAAACAAMYWSARVLGTSRLVAVAAVLSFAWGSAVWYVSTIAEVYALNAFLVSGFLLLALRWEQSRRAVLFFGAVACVAVALGNHTTTAFLVPACAMFACYVAPRFALRISTILGSALIVLVGLTQYWFIVVRNRAGAWGEAPPTNLPDLIQVMIGSEYFWGVMPGGFRSVLESTLPQIGQISLQEVSVAGAALVFVGTVGLWTQRKSALILLVAGAIPYVAFTSVYTPHNVEVFLVPAFLMAWLLAAVGAQRVVDLVATQGGPRGAALMMVALALLPAWQIARNYAARDLSHQRADMRFFDALFDALPDASALVHEDFLIDRMVYYKTLGEKAAEGRRLLALLPVALDPVAAARRDGYGIFAFPATANLMRLADGAEFSYSPLDLSLGPIDRYFADLPRGTIVAVGVPARHLGRFAPDGRLPFDTIGITDDLGGLVMSVAAIGRRGSRSATTITDRVTANATITPDSTDRAALTAPIVVKADREYATIEYGDREIVRSDSGMAVATWYGGRLTAAFSVPASTGFAPTLPTGYAVYPLLSIRQRQTIAAEPVDMKSATATGIFVYSSTGRSQMVMYTGSDRPLAPSLLESTSPQWPSIAVTPFTRASPASERAEAVRADGFPLNAQLLAQPYVYRIVIDAELGGHFGVRVGLGGLPGIAYARVRSGLPGLVYGVDVSTHLTPVEERTASMRMANSRQADLIGTGWSPVQADRIGPYRETIEDRATLLVPARSAAPLRIGVQLLPLPGEPADMPVNVAMQVNTRTVGSVSVQPRWERYWWEIPADAVSIGINDVVLTIAPAGRRIAVSDLLIVWP